MRKKIVMSVAMGAICFLTACGDDLSITVPATAESLPIYTDEQTEDGEMSGVETENNETQEESSEAQEELRSEGSTEPEENAEPEEVTITISAAGDASLGNYYGQGYSLSFRETWEKEQDASYFLENVYDIFSNDDMTIVNLEGSFTNAQERNKEQEFCISGDPEFVEILTVGSVEAVTMANNHRTDFFDQGTADTVETLENAGIPYAYSQYTGVYETKGIRIGFVAVNEVRQPGTEVEKYLQEGIDKLKEEEADLILACCHWGIERDYYPNDYQQELGKKCIDWGADLVLGHHPHVVQGIEEYKGKYIVYSLGNFCFGANRNPKDKDCFIYQQTFTFLDGELQADSSARIIPCSVSSVSNRNDYKPTPAEGDEAQRILDKMNECSIQFHVQFDEEGNIIR